MLKLGIYVCTYAETRVDFCLLSMYLLTSLPASLSVRLSVCPSNPSDKALLAKFDRWLKSPYSFIDTSVGLVANSPVPSPPPVRSRWSS
jgi:hypothetical protein